jgi:hypothetical protein
MATSDAALLPRRRRFGWTTTPIATSRRLAATDAWRGWTPRDAVMITADRGFARLEGSQW